MSTSYSITRDQIITAALRKLQVIELGTTADANTISNAAQTFNYMIKAWQSNGIKLWTINNYILPLVSGQSSYSIGQTKVKTGTVTISNASPGVVTYTSNGLAANTPIVFTTTGALPTGLTAGTTYYVKTLLTVDTFTVSATAGGAVINTSSAGSGVHTATITTPTTVDQTADKPLKIVQAWLRNVSVSPNVDTPLLIISRQEYNLLGSKFATGQPNSIWYDPRTTYGTVSTYLTPDTTTATNFQLYMVGQAPLGDVLLSTDVPDFPNEWMQALVWGLADELAIEYGCHINQRQEIAVRADKYRRELEDWDIEKVSTYFTPDMRTGNR